MRVKPANETDRSAHRLLEGLVDAECDPPAEAARTKRPRGRPRSVAADQAIAAATIELLASGGFSALKIVQVAERAGVGKGTVYRRWPRKELLVTSVLAHIADDRPLPDTGSARDDLAELLRYELGLLTAGLGKVAASVFAEAAFNPVLADALREPTRRRRETLAAVIRRGIERGDLRADLDPETAVDLLWGAVFYRFLLTMIDQDVADLDFVERALDEVWRGFASRSGS